MWSQSLWWRQLGEFPMLWERWEVGSSCVEQRNCSESVGPALFLHGCVSLGCREFAAGCWDGGNSCAVVLLQPTPVILLKEGTDTSQGIPQLVSNINACQVIAEAVRTTLGPRGMDKLIVDDRGRHGAGNRAMGVVSQSSGFTSSPYQLIQHLHVCKCQQPQPVLSLALTTEVRFRCQLNTSMSSAEQRTIASPA